MKIHATNKNDFELHQQKNYFLLIQHFKWNQKNSSRTRTDKFSPISLYWDYSQQSSIKIRMITPQSTTDK